MLNDKAIKAATEGTHRAGDNLYLRVTATGAKTFYVRFRRNGKSKWRRLGAYPEMTLASARLQAADLIKALNSGDAEAQNVTRTVKEAYDRYYTHLTKQYRRPEQTKRIFEVDILPHIGSLTLQKLTRSDCTGMLQHILDRGSPISANRTLEALKRMLSFCEQRGWVDENPMERVKRGAVGGKETPRDIVLSFDEIADFLARLRTTKRMEIGTKWGLYMVLLTGLRSTEVLNLADDGTVKTKLFRTHRVPLTPHIRAMLRHKPKIPTHHGVLWKALTRLEVRFTPHDLRRTFATRLSDLGVMPHVIEKMLDHTMEGVMAIYNHADYWPERVAAQQVWGRKIAELRRKNPRT